MFCCVYVLLFVIILDFFKGVKTLAKGTAFEKWALLANTGTFTELLINVCCPYK